MLRVDQPTSLAIAEIRDEAADLRTYFFDHPLGAQPGQFVMLWVPRVDLKPFGVAYQTPTRFGITVSKVGLFTEALFKKKTGELVGYTGPYGRPFSRAKRKRIAVVGGGYGAATVATLVDQAAAAGQAVDFVVGARTSSRLLYQRRYQGTVVKYHAVTDDGSAGERGLTTDVLARVIAEGGVDFIAACGPERMLVAVAKLAQAAKIPCEVSIERYMKCGFGVCGACSIDGTGERVCAEGTVFEAAHALALPEFGAYHRARSGRKFSV